MKYLKYQIFKLILYLNKLDISYMSELILLFLSFILTLVLIIKI